jgi:hypothetical protein
MNEISSDELKAKIDRGDDFRLVMTLGDLAFQGKHIPGSIEMAYNYLEAQGYKHVRRFSGGLTEWEAAGYPLQGVLVDDD